MSEAKYIWLVVNKYGITNITRFTIIKETQKLYKLGERQEVHGYPEYANQINKDAKGIAFSLEDALALATEEARTTARKAANEMTEALEQVRTFEQAVRFAAECRQPA